jgi:hypothetical protein
MNKNDPAASNPSAAFNIRLSATIAAARSANRCPALVIGCLATAAFFGLVTGDSRARDKIINSSTPKDIRSPTGVAMLFNGISVAPSATTHAPRIMQKAATGWIFITEFYFLPFFHLHLESTVPNL